MKRFFVLATTLGLSVILIGADIHSKPAVKTISKKACLHYTIIEFGKGVDCNGDTVKLVKVNGVQVLASQMNPSQASVLAAN
jgi:hypothetical protein